LKAFTGNFFNNNLKNRFKINTNISIGKVFGFFETNKKELEISQYSVRQATLEQIFNMFAKNSEI
jgi:ATP-binding cassette subfamily A (ABC1) protein 3